MNNLPKASPEKAPEEETILPLHDHGHQTERLLSAMPSVEAFSNARDIFSQLNDPTRLKILWLLSHSEECVTNIACVVQMSAPAVSHHLRSLFESGLLVKERQGKEIYYTLADTPKAALVHRTIDAVFNIVHTPQPK